MRHRRPLPKGSLKTPKNEGGIFLGPPGPPHLHALQAGTHCRRGPKGSLTRATMEGKEGFSFLCAEPNRPTSMISSRDWLAGSTGSSSDCQQKGSSMGTRERTTAHSTPMLGQKTTICGAWEGAQAQEHSML